MSFKAAPDLTASIVPQTQLALKKTFKSINWKNIKTWLYKIKVKIIKVLKLMS